MLLVLYDGDPPEAINVTLDSLGDKPSYKEKGAFYKNIGRLSLFNQLEMRVTTSVDRLVRSRVILL
jgi:hypothetical protein